LPPDAIVLANTGTPKEEYFTRIALVPGIVLLAVTEPPKSNVYVVVIDPTTNKSPFLSRVTE